MDGSAQVTRGLGAAHLAAGAVDWLIDDGAVESEDPSLYHGLAGVLLSLREVQVHFGLDRYQRAAERAADALANKVDALQDSSLYFGLAGVAVALRAVGRWCSC
ncbi:MAG: lanthionine synthetase LanC family protein [Nocardioidaceae bacterium]